MRDLKFKAWDKVKKKWIMGQEPFHIIGEVTVFDLLKQYSIEHFNDIEVVQFTEFKEEKLDIEIFEGDLVKIFEHSEGDTLVKEYIGQVIMNEGEWWVENPKGFGLSVWEYIFGYLGEKVGNVFENPELLEKK